MKIIRESNQQGIFETKRCGLELFRNQDGLLKIVKTKQIARVIRILSF
jgi:hypothetical protein